MPSSVLPDLPEHPAIVGFPSDPDLLAACQQGDQSAWQTLLDKYERLVYSIPLNYGLTHADAADIAQTVFTALIEQLDTLRADSNLGGWLTIATRRQTWRVLKRQNREVNTAVEIESISSLFPGRHDAIEQWELVEWLDRGLSMLGGRCQELLLALYFDQDEPSYAAIARHLQMAEGSIGPTRARCLQRLRDILQDGL
jgi:RNA polymerase sigma factor (sigma-70 family)